MITSLTNKVIELEAVSKKYLLANLTDFWALREISLEVNQGEILGIIGRNGAGKTTLLNIIAGTISPTQGEVNITGKALGLFNLGIGFQDELTGRENIFLNGAILGAGRHELENKFASILEFSELGSFIHQPLGSYSQGMRLRLGFSIVANLDFDILAIDEVLAVGDILFQNKCFQRLMEFRRQGKTLVITNQSMGLIERFSDQVVLLDHGRLLFYGDTVEGVKQYRELLNTEKFFVGPQQQTPTLFENTKKWADDLSSWGKQLGTREIEIDSIEFINRQGRVISQIKSRESLRIKVNFTVKNTVKDVHFGVAIFRRDGVYCYGPNTSFDNYRIPEVKPGKGWFLLEYKEVLLGPGEYNVSVAIWDKNETLAFVYHDGYYNLSVKGSSGTRCVLNLPFRASPFEGFFSPAPNLEKIEFPNADNSSSVQNVSYPGYEVMVKLLDSSGIEKNAYFTNKEAKFVISLNKETLGKDNYILLGIFREDGIFCQRLVKKIGQCKRIEFLFPKLALLPGGYKVALGIWNKKKCGFVSYNQDALRFQMVSRHQDHGTVYLEHKWKWSLPR